MRRLLPPLLVLAVVLAGACATSDAIQENTGGSTTTGTGRLPASSTSSLGGVVDAGPRSCGVASADMKCTTCLDARCCDEGLACAADPTCLMCLGVLSNQEVCSLDHTLDTFKSCLVASCAEPCMLTGTTSSGGGGAPTSSSTGGASTTASSSSTTASSTSSTTTASSTSSSTSTTASSTSSSTSSTSSSGGSACDSVDGAIGCCDSQGVLHFCDVTMTIIDDMCTGTDVCGWNATFGWYDCVPPPGGPDPSNTYPMACGS